VGAASQSCAEGDKNLRRSMHGLPLYAE